MGCNRNTGHKNGKNVELMLEQLGMATTRCFSANFNNKEKQSRPFRTDRPSVYQDHSI